MTDATILLMPLDDGYRAALGSLYLDTTSLSGFGTRVERLLRQRFGDDLEVEYVLSRDLEPKFPACPLCKGTTEIDLDSGAAQYVTDEFVEIDFSKRARGTCPTCKGLGALIAEFWTQSP